MYGIYTYIWMICMVNVGKYTIHGSYGIYNPPICHLVCCTYRFWSPFFTVAFFWMGWNPPNWVVSFKRIAKELLYLGTLSGIDFFWNIGALKKIFPNQRFCLRGKKYMFHVSPTCYEHIRILRLGGRSPAPVDNPLLTVGFIHPRWLFRSSSINSIGSFLVYLGVFFQHRFDPWDNCIWFIP